MTPWRTVAADARSIRRRLRQLLAAILIAAALVPVAAAEDLTAPCAACIVLAVAPGELQAAADAGLPTALIVPMNSPDQTVAALGSLVAQLRPVAIVLDARDVGPLTDAARYRLRTTATAVRSAVDRPIGIELLSLHLRDETIDTLAGYVDFVVLPPGTDSAAIANRLPGVPVWTGAPPGDTLSALDIVTTQRIEGSDRLLVRLPAARTDVIFAIAAMLDVLPSGLTPLPDVRVSCDRPCDASVYLNPQTLEAVAIVRPQAMLTRITVSPAATALATFGDVHARSAGARLDLPATAAAFVLQIRGWRGAGGEAFATGVQVSGARQLTVDEIIARHQAARARQERTIRTLISTGSTVLSFHVPGFPGPVTVTAQTTVFSGGGQTDVEQQQIRVNGLDLQRAPGDVPKLPLIEPERVGTPPLAIALTEAYSYELRGREHVNDRDAYIVSFAPRDSRQTLVSGRAWIDSQTFLLTRTDALQTGLRGAIASSREEDDYEAGEQDGIAISFLRRAEIFQVYVGPAESTPIHRVVSFDRHEVNAIDYQSRLEAAHRSDAVLLRDTPHGYRFLVPQSTTADGQLRQVSASSREHVATAVIGSLFDPNISVPLVFAGISYVDFNLFRTGTQLNAFFGGLYGRASWATPAFIANRWRLSGEASGIAVSYNDRAIRAGVEHYDENIRQRPAQLSLALLGPIASAMRLRAGYELAYTRYARSESTTPNFLIPASTPVHGARIALEAEHGPWNATGWFSVARRQQWQQWGLTPSATQLEAQVFERFGATLARSIIWSPRAVGRVEAAWMKGLRLDRFSGFAFGSFDNPLRGYPAFSIRYNSGVVVRSVATFSPSSSTRVRFDAFGDAGVVRRQDDGRAGMYPGFGAAVEAPAPFGWLLAAEWGFGVRGVNTNGSTGTHVLRISGYKVF